MKARDVTVGARIWRHGYQWQVTAIHHDAVGNAGMHEKPMPRIVFIADACGTDHSLPHHYARDMTLGYLPDAEVTV